MKILEKNLMILASAGSGKTYQLGNRVIGLVACRDVDPERLVALTFTRKAAGEFADSVLTKLAEAVGDEAKAGALGEAIGGSVDAPATLERVVRSMPRLQLGTMDGFFARVVRGFQYELGLTGGTFDLVEGPELEAAQTEILGALLGEALDGSEARDFLQAYKRATMGREERGVEEPLRKFVKHWHGLWKVGDLRGVESLSSRFGGLPEVGEWEEKKRALVGRLRPVATGKPVADLLDAFEAHTVGSGWVRETGKTLFTRMAEAVGGQGAIEVKFGRGVIGFDATASKHWRELFGLLVRCELAAAVERTKAVVALVGTFDSACELRLRRRGMLGFDDIKVLMGEWMGDEDARLRREAVDFRLDARYDHWLLDEFQDTSRAEWNGMFPLLQEAVSDPEGSLFVVGDPKQAIYGWRGGDVGLFEEVGTGFGGGVEVETMPTSWRSAPAVLELVNRVCGAGPVIEELFGRRLGERWPWEEHEAARPELDGAARVEIVEGKVEERHERMVELMRELGVGERAMSCGVLVRTNDQMAAVADRLRGEGFDVIEEGRRRPTRDQPVGVALFHLIAWLADPADAFARRVVGMSPLAALLEERFGGAWQAAWEGLLDEAADAGFAGILEGLVERLWDGLSEFGRRRAGDVIGALAAYDAGGGVSARGARQWIADLEVAQSPGTAAVQVMTVHKAKGLGFDVVILPEIEDKQVPNAGKFEVARGDGWLLQPPAQWVREMLPELREAEEHWGEDQRYEALCVLYVALTRAKQGLYVLLPEAVVKRKDGEGFASPANLLRRAIGAEETGVVFESGDGGWVGSFEPRVESSAPDSIELAAGVPLRERSTPSGPGPGGNGAGLMLGSAIHEAFERVGWVDAEPPDLPDDKAGRRVGELLQMPELRPRFERRGRAGVLHREVPVEAVVDERWMSGVIDRLHLWNGPDGQVEQVEVIDFKTDAVGSPDELVERHAPQLKAYRRVLSEMHPDARVEVWMLSTRLGEWVELP